jgi:hypothetical protein
MKRCGSFCRFPSVLPPGYKPFWVTLKRTAFLTKFSIASAFAKTQDAEQANRLSSELGRVF